MHDQETINVQKGTCFDLFRHLLSANFCVLIMENQDLKQQSMENEPNLASTGAVNEIASKTKEDTTRKKVMAKRGLRSLTAMIALPTLLTVAGIVSSVSGNKHREFAKYGGLVVAAPWVIHTASLVSSLLMGLSGWLFWAEGGFHKRPRTFYPYLAWLVLQAGWEPVVMGYGAGKLGLAMSVGMTAALLGCYQVFQSQNPTAKTLVMPCIGLAGLMTLVSLQLARHS